MRPSGQTREADANPNAAVAAVPPEAEICGCNGVSKGKVVAAIEGGACTLDAVRACTKASASCGSCTGLVKGLLAVTLGAIDTPVTELLAGRPAAPAPDRGPIVCDCFDVGLKTIIAAIADRALVSVEAVGAAINAGTNCGSCRPAIAKLLPKEPVHA